MHLGDRAVVQCSKEGHTLLQLVRVIMERLPTLVVAIGASIQSPLSYTKSWNEELSDSLDSTLNMGVACGLPVVFVAPEVFSLKAREILPGNSVVAPLKSCEDFLVNSLITGVLARPQAAGWLILPVVTNVPRAETLYRVAKSIEHESIVLPLHNQLTGHPIGFSSELFSELIQLQSLRDINRLIARYPTHCIEVDDPGVLLS